MAKKTDIDEIISNNPKVDAGQVREAQLLVQELRKQGLGRPEYNLTLPYQNGLRRLQAAGQPAGRCFQRRGRSA